MHVIDSESINLGASIDHLSGPNPLVAVLLLYDEVFDVIQAVKVDFKCVRCVDLSVLGKLDSAVKLPDLVV
jgi:hypothetical protein